MDIIRFSSVLEFGTEEKQTFLDEIWDGAADRWGSAFTPEIVNRLNMEIATFEQVDGYMSYLYFVWRVMGESRYFVMAHRTFAHASVVCYALGITRIDPIRLGLDFNRFMPTDAPRFVGIQLVTNATKGQILDEVMNLGCRPERERLGRREMYADTDALTICANQRTARLIGWFNDLVDFDFIPFDDPETLQALARSEDLLGVYGCSVDSVLPKYLSRMGGRFEDLVPLCAAYLTLLPLDGSATVGRGIEAADRFAPEMEALLNETDGRILYDEQFCAIASLAGYAPSEALDLRKVLVMRRNQRYDAHRRRFADLDVFDKLTRRGLWCISKTIAAEYAWLIYITAYLKLHYPVEYMRAALSAVADSNA